MTRVGYDTVGLRGDGEAKGLGPSFINVGTDPIKLKDLIVTGYGPGEGESTGVSCKRLDGAGRQEGNEFFWWDFDYSEGAPRSGTEGVDWCYGWYSLDCSTPYNDEELVPGEGLWVYSGSTQYKIQNSGAVAPAPISINLRGDGEAKLVANPMPATIKFKDVWIDGYGEGEGESTGVSFKYLDGSGRQDGDEYFWWDFDYSEGAPYSGTEGVDWCYGWYSLDCSTPYNNNDLTAGIGMWIYSASATYTVNFKSPIQKDAE